MDDALQQLTIPEAIRQIMDGDGSTNFCSNCRQPNAPLRCSRCKMTTYCMHNVRRM